MKKLSPKTGLFVCLFSAGVNVCFAVYVNFWNTRVTCNFLKKTANDATGTSDAVKLWKDLKLYPLSLEVNPFGCLIDLGMIK